MRLQTEQLVIFASHPTFDEGKGFGMRKMSGLLLGAAMLVPILGTGCGPRRQVQVDVWGPGETTYYTRWEHDTDRDHVAWDQRNEHDREAYWKWRHHHPD